MTINKQIYADNAKTILASGISPSDTTIFVIDGSAFPVPNQGEFFQITLEWADSIEVINVYSRVGNTLSNCVRARSNHTAQNFPDGTVVQMRISSETLAGFARLKDRMDEISSVDALSSPNSSDGNSYICHSADFGGGHIVAIKTTSNKWSFTTHGTMVVSGTIESVGVNTLTSSSVASRISDVVPGKYLLQFTSGDNRGLVRMVTSSAPNSISWVTALPNILNTGVTFEIYQSHASLIAQLIATTGASGGGDASKVNKAGDTMTGILKLAGNPIDEMDAVPLLFLNQALSNSNALVRKPLNVTPGLAAVGVSTGVTLQANNYYSLYGVAQNAAQFQVSTSADFAAPVRDVTLGAVNSWTVIPLLNIATPYFWRCRFKDAEDVWSAWSNSTSFSTGSILVNAPTLTSPSAGATGISTSPTLTSSAFSVTGGSDTHLSSRWQLSTDSNFTTIAVDSTESTTDKLSFTVPTTLSFGVTYYARVRHTGVTNGQSAWSAVSTFVTFNGGVSTPSMVSPGAGATGVSVNPTLATSAFSNIGPTDTHLNTDWEIRTADNGGGTLVWSSYANTVNKTSINASAALTFGVVYYVRALHRGTLFGASSWSTSIPFTTVSGTAAQPTIISPVSGSTGVSLNPVISTSAFSSSSGDTHASTDWEIRTAPGGAGSVVWSSLNNNVNKVDIVASGLSTNTVYYIRARHKGATFGWSPWSNSSTITTLAASGEAIFTSAGAFNWMVPEGVTTISAFGVGPGGRGVAMGGGNNVSAGGGGGAAWVSNLSVTPGQVLKINIINNDDYQGTPNAGMTLLRDSLTNATILKANGGGWGVADGTAPGGTAEAYGGTSRAVSNGGSGGRSLYSDGAIKGGGGGGAGGYEDFGSGGNGSNAVGPGSGSGGGAGAGGAGGGGMSGTGWATAGGGGGGVGIYGQGASGAAQSGNAYHSSEYDSYSNGAGGNPGSGGTAGEGGSGGGAFTPVGGPGGSYGGGAGGSMGHVFTNPGRGALRIIWGPGRSYPNNAA